MVCVVFLCVEVFVCVCLCVLCFVVFVLSDVLVKVFCWYLDFWCFVIFCYILCCVGVVWVLCGCDVCVVVRWWCEWCGGCVNGGCVCVGMDVVCWDRWGKVWVFVRDVKMCWWWWGVDVCDWVCWLEFDVCDWWWWIVEWGVSECVGGVWGVFEVVVGGGVVGVRVRVRGDVGCGVCGFVVVVVEFEIVCVKWLNGVGDGLV